MANYRTIKELKSYKGYKITRLHSNGKYTYMTRDQSGGLITAASLKQLKNIITERCAK